MKPRDRLVQRAVHRHGETPRWVLSREPTTDPALLQLKQLFQTRRRVIQVIGVRIARLEQQQRERRP
jgi:hypothetical protein